MRAPLGWWPIGCGRCGQWKRQKPTYTHGPYDRGGGYDGGAAEMLGMAVATVAGTVATVGDPVVCQWW